MQIDRRSFLNSAVRIIEKEGNLAFYKGVGGPLISMPLVNSIIFCSYQLTKGLLEEHGRNSLTDGIFLFKKFLLLGELPGFVTL